MYKHQFDVSGYMCSNWLLPYCNLKLTNRLCFWLSNNYGLTNQFWRTSLYICCNKIDYPRIDYKYVHTISFNLILEAFTPISQNASPFWLFKFLKNLEFVKHSNILLSLITTPSNSKNTSKHRLLQPVYYS